MLKPITRKIGKEADGGVYRYTFYCDICGIPKRSSPYQSDTTSASQEERERESKDAYERANLEMMRLFNRCPVCGKVVCDDCFRVFDDQDPIMCKECSAAETGKAGRKKRHKYLVAAALILLITGAGVLHLLNVGADYVKIEDHKMPTSDSPYCM